MYTYKTKSKTILGDMHTPVSAYMRLRDIGIQSALMESNDYHGNDNSRSFIGISPIASFSVEHGVAVFKMPGELITRKPITANYRVETALSEFLANFEVKGDDAKYCGLYGYTSFNAVRYFEDIPVEDTYAENNDAPDMLYILFKTVVVFNHYSNTLTIIDMLQDGEDDCILKIEQALLRTNVREYKFRTVGDTTSTLTDEQHKANIREGIKHCLRGDVFQIVLSRRFIQKYEGDDFMLYRSLRSINPSPYLFYFDFGGLRIFGSSPETHCRIREWTRLHRPDCRHYQAHRRPRTRPQKRRISPQRSQGKRGTRDAR